MPPRSAPPRTDSARSAPAPDRSAKGCLPNLWLVVPVKPFGEGKSRLARTLDRAQRDAYSRRWLARVLTTAKQWGGFAGMAVISHDPAVWALTQRLGAQPVEETGEGLNPALEQARAAVMAAGAEAVLVLPSDLPLLTVDDLAQLADLPQAGRGMVIAPSHDGGTNALLLRPPDAIPYSFGAASFARHLAFAQAAGLPYRVYHSSTLALDVDYPEDLAALGTDAAANSTGDDLPESSAPTTK